MTRQPDDAGAALAAELDATDPLRAFRGRFVVPDPDLVYLDGNSLGRLPAETPAVVAAAMEEWGRDLVRGWERWLNLGLDIGDELAPIVGAGPGELALCDQTSVNVFKLATAAVEDRGRPDIVTDEGNFPSDRYVLEAVAARAGGTVRVVAEEPRPSDVAAAVDAGVGLVALTHVSYRSSAVLDMAGITEAAAERGAAVLWDLSHSAGAVPVDLHGCGVELAVGCTYKYLNGGPGAPAFLYVSGSAQERLRQPIQGWFGHADQFGFEDRYRPAPGIRGFTVGTPPILSMVAAGVGIRMVAQAGMSAIAAKGRHLTGRFLDWLGGAAEVVSPTEVERRGCHVTVRHPDGYRLSRALRARKVVVDFRAPDLVRFGFSPLTTSFDDARRAAAELRAVLAAGDHLAMSSGQDAVT